MLIHHLSTIERREPSNELCRRTLCGTECDRDVPLQANIQTAERRGEFVAEIGCEACRSVHRRAYPIHEPTTGRALAA